MTTVSRKYIVSIDVGIKNLAICIFEKEEDLVTGPRPNIHKWVVLNISNSTSDEDLSTKNTTKTKCCLCKHNAKYSIQKDDKQIVYCMKHAKASTEYIVPSGEYTQQKIKKYKLSDLVRVLTPWVPSSIPMPKTKNDWGLFYNSVVLSPFIDNDFTAPTMCSEVSLIDVSRFLTQKMDILTLPYLPEIQTVLIENQISPIANRMKSVQSMITQYFVMKNPSIDIIYVSSSHKLDGIETDSYSARKKAGIKKCAELLVDTPKWVSYVLKHKKKDDLTDCYLQGHWYITQPTK
jgi:hypothetical protein